jgi:predicted GNAT family acetyltransferase
MNRNNITIKHDQQHQMFSIKLNGGAASLQYDKPEENVLDITKTYVPESSRSNGLASLLVKHALDIAYSQSKYVIPSCSFAEDYIEKHPEYEELLYSNKGT